MLKGALLIVLAVAVLGGITLVDGWQTVGNVNREYLIGPDDVPLAPASHCERVRRIARELEEPTVVQCAKSDREWLREAEAACADNKFRAEHGQFMALLRSGGVGLRCPRT